MNRQLTSGVGIAILIVLFIAVNILAGAALRQARVDLTDSNLYTLSEASKRVIEQVDEPIRLKFYYSEGLASEAPSQLRQYGQRVWELLQEYERYAGDNIILEKIDPEPFSEAEDDAAQGGLQSVSITQEDAFYFGLIGTNMAEGREVIPFFDPRKERFLEYDISQMVWSLAHPEKPVVGLLSSLPVSGGRPQFPGQQPQQPWLIMDEIRALLEVQSLEPSLREVPEEVDVLLVIHPKNFSAQAQYAIDQFLMRGKPALIFVDPLCEADMPPGAQQNPMQAMQADRSSSLDRLFDAWNIQLVEQQVAADREYAMRVSFGRGGQSGPFVPFISLDKAVINDDDAVTGLLESINFAYAGVLRRSDQSNESNDQSNDAQHASSGSLQWTPLITTSEQSMLLEAQQMQLMTQPKKLLADFEPGDERLTLAGRLHGPLPSAFPDGPPNDESNPNQPDESDSIPNHRAKSEQPVNLIVCGDVDVLTDRLWARRVQLGGMSLGHSKIADNADFLINALENMAGSGELATLRARGTYSRPFTLVEEIRREAEQNYLAEEQRLEEKRRELQQKIRQLQQARPDSGELVLSKAQREELENYEQQQLETRDKLRQVRYNLNADVERLGTTVKIINTAAMPVLVTIIAIGLGAYRARRRRVDRQSMSIRE